jgi:hypothetical protein
MIIANRTLNVIDSAFIIVDRIERVDCIKLGRTVIDKAIILAAVIVAVTTYVITACQLWWLTHSETIIISTTRFVINTADFAHEVFVMGQELRRFITKTFNLAADSAFFTIASL